eukprot:TRINITY_DN63919_c0_g1_i1.p1 TRINITY_DN63919_c0_g1~~TRINITY_DN63919_c0_g1_i1.p1  ORF type:complete len:756 (-),score=57.06 TRINITY_DN63919_c0_g1_i1:831-3098(-)
MYNPKRRSQDRPCHKLSVDLLATYKRINELFYEAKRKNRSDPKKSYNDGYDDEHGNYVVQTGEEINRRYIVQDVLGKGSFGVVVKAHDNRYDTCVAIKIIKNKVQFYHQAKVEIEILTRLNSAGDDNNVVKLKKVFTWKDHLCLVFELLSFNLYDLLRYTKFSGVSLSLIKKFAFQILKTLEHLALAPTRIIHCDLKPENILLKNPKRSAIKVIDFGSSCFVDKKVFKYIQSRFYRSPEVILGLSYDCAIDMWSLACILVEMHTGMPLFDGKDEAEQLCKMAAVCGCPPQKMIEQSGKKKNFFQWDEKTKKYVLAPPHKDPNKYPKSTLEEILGAYTGGPGGRRRKTPGHAEADYHCFIELVKQMLIYTPKDRISPTAALQHPFLQPVVDAEAEKPQRVLAPRSKSSGSGRGNVEERSRSHNTTTSSTVSNSTAHHSSSQSRTHSSHTHSTHSNSSGREHGRNPNRDPGAAKRSLSLGGTSIHHYQSHNNNVSGQQSNASLPASSSSASVASSHRSHSHGRERTTAASSASVTRTGRGATRVGGTSEGSTRNPAYSRSHSAYGSTHAHPAPDQYPQYQTPEKANVQLNGSELSGSNIPLRLQPKQPGSTGQADSTLDISAQFAGVPLPPMPATTSSGVPFPTSPSASELFSPTYAATQSSQSRFESQDGAAQSLAQQQPTTPRTGVYSSPPATRQNLTDEPPQQLVGVPATHAPAPSTNAINQPQPGPPSFTPAAVQSPGFGEHGGAEPMTNSPA